MNIHIVDYGMGNIFSVQKKILQEGASVSISSDPEDIFKADKIVLCGVGHFWVLAEPKRFWKDFDV